MARSDIPLRARRLMIFAAEHNITCNREDIMRRIGAWDAQVAAMRRKYSATELQSSKQLSLLSSVGPSSTWPRTHWPRR